MSASLVGSEMCIRDRAPRMPPAAGPREIPARPQGSSSVLLGRGVGSVSYTHLTLPTICSV
eukprot:2755919-Alexandrium_andersonii.AAC.1